MPISQYLSIFGQAGAAQKSISTGLSAFRPVIEKLSVELDDSAVIAKLNVDENPELAAQFSVMSIPTLVFIRDGKLVGRRTGVTPKATLLSMLNSVNA